MCYAEFFISVWMINHKKVIQSRQTLGTLSILTYYKVKQKVSHRIEQPVIFLLIISAVESDDFN